MSDSDPRETPPAAKLFSSCPWLLGSCSSGLIFSVCILFPPVLQRWPNANRPIHSQWRGQWMNVSSLSHPNSLVESLHKEMNVLGFSDSRGRREGNTRSWRFPEETVELSAQSTSACICFNLGTARFPSVLKMGKRSLKTSQPIQTFYTKGNWRPERLHGLSKATQQQNQDQNPGPADTQPTALAAKHLSREMAVPVAQTVAGLQSPWLVDTIAN